MTGRHSLLPGSAQPMQDPPNGNDRLLGCVQHRHNGGPLSRASWFIQDWPRCNGRVCNAGSEKEGGYSSQGPKLLFRE